MKLGTTELLIVLAVVLIMFGPTQLPKLARMFGKSVKGFRDGMEDREEASGTDTRAVNDAGQKNI